jgi:hypothetical protein
VKQRGGRKRKIGSGHDRSGLTYYRFFRIERFFGRRSSFLGRTNVPIGLFDVQNFDRFFYVPPYLTITSLNCIINRD